jgi:hypothetical protein
MYVQIEEAVMRILGFAVAMIVTKMSMGVRMAMLILVIEEIVGKKNNIIYVYYKT